MQQRSSLLLGAALTVATSTLALAQPAPPRPGPGDAAGSLDPQAPTPDPAAADPRGPRPRPAQPPGADEDPHDDALATHPAPTTGPLLPGTEDHPARPAPPAKPDPRIDMPQLIVAPTGWLLPAAVLYSKTGLDTGGGFTSDSRVGLGDVAEFGVASSDQVRAKNIATDHADRLQPYITASFRMGVAEDRLFVGQPGVTLGFRKSFEQTINSVKTQVAELTLVASKKLGDRAAVHVGGAFWDASMQGDTRDATQFTLHGGAIGNQVRPFGGFQVRPLDRSEIMVELSWAPEFCYTCTGDNNQIRLRPELAWGVRYQVADWAHLESGVRVPDIGKANLLEAQIFGQLTITSWALRHVVDELK